MNKKRPLIHSFIQKTLSTQRMNQPYCLYECLKEEGYAKHKTKYHSKT
jgi:hypothetical protein